MGNFYLDFYSWMRDSCVLMVFFFFFLGVVMFSGVQDLIFRLKCSNYLLPGFDDDDDKLIFS